MLTHYIIKVGEKFRKLYVFEDSKKERGLTKRGVA